MTALTDEEVHHLVTDHYLTLAMLRYWDDLADHSQQVFREAAILKNPQPAEAHDNTTRPLWETKLVATAVELAYRHGFEELQRTNPSQKEDGMAGVYIQPEDSGRFGLDIAAIEKATGRKVTAVWRNSEWFDDNVPELAEHAYGTPGFRRVMSSLEIYFDCGHPCDSEQQDSTEASPRGTKSPATREDGRAD